ncbi:C2H2-type zinc finger protein [Pantoea agglomerans]|uniref:C2H2-type zinc finger protein n=1 Tax=Enterobacter agglomerans TaxID=549 RepID=UPI001654BE46|nr:C2H2-type zinc finger protein [Pantoea agglomerans]
MTTCNICGMTYAEDDADDRKTHADRHKKLAKGILPHHIREFMKQAGYAVAHNDGGLDRMKGTDPELGKLAVAFSWWNRALAYGAPTKDFDAYMKAHLQFADSLVTGNGEQESRRAIKKWEQYAG